MDPASLAKFLGVILTQGLDKDEILTQFIRRECDADGYQVPEVLPFDHEFRVFTLKPLCHPHTKRMTSDTSSGTDPKAKAHPPHEARSSGRRGRSGVYGTAPQVEKHGNSKSYTHSENLMQQAWPGISMHDRGS